MELTAMLPRPQVHMFVDDLDQPYVGYIETRDFYRGEDAARAISGLGYPPSTLPASRLLMVWEHADLLTALELPAPVHESALAFLDATVDDHRINWYPYTASLGSRSRLDLTWGQPRTLQRPTLPAPIAEALAIWRQFIPEDFEAMVATLTQNGYEFTPVTRRPADPPT
jgi:hypothetical protein